MASVERVRDATLFPLSAVAEIVVTFEDGWRVRGTGAVIGPNDVLTASHLVDDDPERGAVTAIEVTPGRNGAVAPFGDYAASARVFFRIDEDADGRIGYRETQRDYALLTVETPDPIGLATGWFGFGSLSAPPGAQVALETASYPAGLQDGGPLEMYRGSDRETFDGAVIVHDYEEETGLDYSGASGAPFWRATEDGPVVVGVHSTSAWASHLSAAAVADIRGWVAENGDGSGAEGPAPAPDAATSERSSPPTEGADTILGGAAGERVDALGGDDEIATLSGDDTIDAGAGNDVVKSGAGDDRIIGGPGDDVVLSGDGDDAILAGAGNDYVKPGRGDDTVLGGEGDDVVAGFRGDERFEGGEGADRLLGSVDDDTLIGGPGDDRLWGGPGYDVFVFEDLDFGRDVLPLDFRVGSDRLDFTSVPGLSRSDFSIRQVGANVVLEVGEGVLVMNGARFGGLDATEMLDRFDDVVLL